MAYSYLSPEVARCRGDLRQSLTARIILATNNSPSYAIFHFSILSAHLLLLSPFQADSLLLTYSLSCALSMKEEVRSASTAVRVSVLGADRWLYLLLLKLCKPEMEGKPEVGASSSFSVFVNESSTSPLWVVTPITRSVNFSGELLLTGRDLRACICHPHTCCIQYYYYSHLSYKYLIMND